MLERLLFVCPESWMPDFEEGYFRYRVGPEQLFFCKENCNK